MVRVRSNVATQRRKKRVLKQAKGQFGHRRTRYKQAIMSVVRGMVYEYRDRKVNKRSFRSLWIVRINAACQEQGINYSQFIKGLVIANVSVNRKVIAELAVNEPKAFERLVQLSKESIKQKSSK